MRSYLLLALATLVAFGDCARGSFHFDDYTMLAGVWNRPLTQLTFWVNHWVGGADPAGYHAVNLLLHVAVVLLLFDVLKAAVGQEAALLGAGLFAVHPIQSEAVAYVFARGTLLSALFCLLCWKCWARGKLWQAVAWFGVALLCKEECVAFPLFLVLIGPRVWPPIGAMLGLAAAVGARSIYLTKIVAGSGAGFTAGISPLDYLAVQGVVILRYFRLLLVPWGFTIDPEISAAEWEKVLAWAVIAVLVFVFRHRVWFIGALILLLPSSSIFPAADVAADRRMYLPMLSLVGIVGGLLPSVKRSWVLIGYIALIAISIFRMEVWRTERNLWAEAVQSAPSKARPRIQLARAIPPAEGLAVLSSAPATAEVVTERGRVYLDLGRPADALREFGRALAMRPGDAHAVNNRGAALLALGQKAAARADFELALALDPTLRDAKANLTTATGR